MTPQGSATGFRWARSKPVHHRIGLSRAKITGSYATIGACAFAIYYFARLAAAAKPPGKSRLWQLWRYLRCVLASGVIGYYISVTLGTYTEDAEPLPGGQEVVADYAPGDVQGATIALKVFLGVLLSGLNRCPALFFSRIVRGRIRLSSAYMDQGEPIEAGSEEYLRN